VSGGVSCEPRFLTPAAAPGGAPNEGKEG
jgi:hypothetical protein